VVRAWQNLSHLEETTTARESGGNQHDRQPKVEERFERQRVALLCAEESSHSDTEGGQRGHKTPLPSPARREAGEKPRGNECQGGESQFTDAGEQREEGLGADCRRPNRKKGPERSFRVSRATSLQVSRARQSQPRW